MIDNPPKRPAWLAQLEEDAARLRAGLPLLNVDPEPAGTTPNPAPSLSACHKSAHRARRLRPDSEKHVVSIAARFTRDEAAIIRAAASAADKRPSNWFRTVLLACSMPRSSSSPSPSLPASAERPRPAHRARV